MRLQLLWAVHRDGLGAVKEEIVLTWYSFPPVFSEASAKARLQPGIHAAIARSGF